MILSGFLSLLSGFLVIFSGFLSFLSGFLVIFSVFSRILLKKFQRSFLKNKTIIHNSTNVRAKSKKKKHVFGCFTKTQEVLLLKKILRYNCYKFKRLFYWCLCRLSYLMGLFARICLNVKQNNISSSPKVMPFARSQSLDHSKSWP